MKKLSLFILAVVAIGATGCLKDKKFDDNEYGIQISEKKAVSFPQSSASPVTYGINSQATTQTVDGPDLVIEHSGSAAANITVQLQLNNTLVTDAGLTPLPANAYQVALTHTIPAGGKLVSIPVVIPNSGALDPNVAYGIGLTITSVDQGYIAVANQKNIVLAFTIKNQWDGKYTLRGQFYHPANDPNFSHHEEEVELHTSGPNSVKLYSDVIGDYWAPVFVNGGIACCFANQVLGINVNAATNAATMVNAHPAGTIVYDPILTYNGNNYNNRWNPATKTFYAAYGYQLGAGNTVAIGTSRAWIDTLIYKGPR